MNIVYCIDSKVIGYFNNSVNSLLKHNPDANIIVITSDESVNVPYKTILFNPPIEQYKFNGIKDRITPAAYFRIHLPEILKDLDKCLYIDADTLIFKSLEPLYNIDVDYIGGCEELDNVWIKRQKDQLNISKYINSGMLLMNLKNLRSDNFTNKCISEIPNIKCYPWFHDQTVINKVYNDKITILDRTYNWCITFDEYPLYLLSNTHNVTIGHFIGSLDRKIWQTKIMSNKRTQGGSYNVVYCVDDNKSQIEQLKLSIFSLVYHNPNYTITVLTTKHIDNLPFNQIIVKPEQYTYFEKYHSQIGNRRPHFHSSAVYMKLLVPEYFKGKVLFLDNDTLVLKPLDDLFENYNSGINAIKSCFDASANIDLYGKMGINSGVCLFNIDKLEDYSNKIRNVELKQLYDRHILFSYNNDETILYHAFHNEIEHIPEYFNCLYNTIKTYDNNYVIHYLAECKPWQYRDFCNMFLKKFNGPNIPVRKFKRNIFYAGFTGIGKSTTAKEYKDICFDLDAQEYRLLYGRDAPKTYEEYKEKFTPMLLDAICKYPIIFVCYNSKWCYWLLQDLKIPVTLLLPKDKEEHLNRMKEFRGKEMQGRYVPWLEENYDKLINSTITMFNNYSLTKNRIEYITHASCLVKDKSFEENFPKIKEL